MLLIVCLNILLSKLRISETLGVYLYFFKKIKKIKTSPCPILCFLKIVVRGGLVFASGVETIF
jgi:hypothetical protein